MYYLLAYLGLWESSYLDLKTWVLFKFKNYGSYRLSKASHHLWNCLSQNLQNIKVMKSYDIIFWILLRIKVYETYVETKQFSIIRASTLNGIICRLMVHRRTRIASSRISKPLCGPHQWPTSRDIQDSHNSLLDPSNRTPSACSHGGWLKSIYDAGRSGKMWDKSILELTQSFRERSLLQCTTFRGRNSTQTGPWDHQPVTLVE